MGSGGVRVTIVGAGLAGSEAALFLARAGAGVNLVEMRPAVMTPAHETELFGELVCSNSLGAETLETGKGLLKAELKAAGSALIPLAEAARVPAGKALAVDRTFFAQSVTAAVRAHPAIRVIPREACEIPADPLAIMACGPLPSDALSAAIRGLLGGDGLFFYDAISPIVEAASLDMSEGFVADRYGAGGGDYLNFPMTRERYEEFLSALLSARLAPARDFEEERYFEACMPVEALARRGPDTLLFGPLRPVGLRDPRTGRVPHAVVQLRKENAAGTMYNIVGFQTRLARPEQERVFGMIPGLARARYLRYGSIHRNSFIDAPRHLLPSLECRRRPGLFFAGQVTGVEGYVESIASGLAAAVSALARLKGQDPPVFPPESMTGALIRHITSARPGPFQPMNANFGLLPVPQGAKKKERKAKQAQAALAALARFREAHPDLFPPSPVD